MPLIPLALDNYYEEELADSGNTHILHRALPFLANVFIWLIP